MMYYGGFLYHETYNLPVAYKRWFIERIVKEINQSGGDPNGGGGAQTRAVHQNTPEIRSMQGRTRTQVPSRMRRFT